MKRHAGRARPDRRAVQPSGPVPLTAPFTLRWLASRMQALAGAGLRGQRVCVAFSGGLDSRVLLDALAALRARSGLQLRAVHVDHGLHPDSALWAGRARDQARATGVDCRILALHLRPRRGDSVEAQARTARYRALRQQLKAGESLVTAHHQDDQLETLLLALMRGSGLRGLCGMAGRQDLEGAWLLRPLLPVPRDALERYARRRHLEWIEDPSNADPRFDRNFLRQRILPALRERWPAAAATAMRSAHWIAEAQELLQQLAARDLSGTRDGGALRVSALRCLTPALRRNALRRWLAELGLRMPDHRRLEQIAGAVLEARSDAVPLVQWEGGALRRFGDRLLAGPAQMLTEPQAEHLRAGAWDWQRHSAWSLGEGAVLRIVRDRCGDIRLDRLPCPVQVGFRSGGERLREAYGSRALKDLLQTSGIAPWDRARAPLLCVGRDVLAVADIWLAPAIRAAPADTAPRGRLLWERPGAE